MGESDQTVGTDIDLEAADAVERLVLSIKRRGPGRAFPPPDTEGVVAFLSHVANEEPMNAAEHQERERLWRIVDASVEVLDTMPAWPEDSVARA